MTTTVRVTYYGMDGEGETVTKAKQAAYRQSVAEGKTDTEAHAIMCETR